MTSQHCFQVNVAWSRNCIFMTVSRFDMARINGHRKDYVSSFKCSSWLNEYTLKTFTKSPLGVLMWPLSCPIFNFDICKFKFLQMVGKIPGTFMHTCSQTCCRALGSSFGVPLPSASFFLWMLNMWSSRLSSSLRDWQYRICVEAKVKKICLN